MTNKERSILTMGINFDGVNPEVKAKLEGIVSDDKVTAEEVKGLSEAEQAALSKALGGIDLPKTGEIKLVSEPNMPKEEPGLFEKAWDWVKENPRKAVGCAVIIAACVITAGAFGAFGATTAATIKGVGTWIAANRATVGLGCIAGCAVLTSCNKEDFEEPEVIIEGNTTIINDNVYFNVQVSDPALRTAVDSINERLEKIEKNQEQGNQYLNSIVALLTSLFAKITSIEAQGTEHTKLLTKIFECLNSHMTGTAENFDKLYAYLDKLNNTIETMDSNCAKYHELILEKLDTISGKLDTLTENNQTLFNLVLAELTSGRMLSEESLAVLNKILEKIDNNETMDAKTHELLQTIITNQGKMNDDMNAGFLDILDNLGDLTDEVKDGFIKVINGQNLTLEQLNTIINNQNAQSTQFEEIRELIVQNNKIAQGTQDAVKDMSANMTNEHNAILNAIKNVQAGGGDYSDLKAILEEIRDNTSVLPDVQQQLCLVGTAIEKILEEVKGIRVETQKGLLAILAKIPNGCTCKEVNLSGILEKLDELLAELKKDPTDNTDEPDNDKDDHEGILKNLEDYFG